MKGISTVLLLCIIGFNALAQSTTYVSFSYGAFYAVDWQNCNMRFIGITEYGYADIAFTTDGRLWGVSEYDDLKQIDTANGSTILSKSIPFTNALIGLNDSLLLCQGQERLSTMNVNTGANHFIEYTGFNSDGDFAKVNGSFYITSEGRLIKMELNATYDSVLSKSVINDNINNPVPQCLGLIQSPLPLEENILIGFTDTSVYRINILDGSYSYVCDVMSVEKMWGAACWNPASGSTGVGGQKDDQLSFGLSPNPVKQNGSIYIALPEKQNRKFASASIYSMQGRLVYRDEAPELFNGKLEVDLVPLNISEGIFVVEVMTATNRWHALLKVER